MVLLILLLLLRLLLLRVAHSKTVAILKVIMLDCPSYSRGEAPEILDYVERLRRGNFVGQILVGRRSERLEQIQNVKGSDCFRVGKEVQDDGREEIVGYLGRGVEQQQGLDQRPEEEETYRQREAHRFEMLRQLKCFGSNVIERKRKVVGSRRGRQRSTRGPVNLPSRAIYQRTGSKVGENFVLPLRNRDRVGDWM